jgi:NAD+ synthase
MKKFGRDVLDIDCGAVLESLTLKIREVVGRVLNKRGSVLGVSGGIDSAVCAAMAAKAMGPKNTLALLMPESDSASESLDLGKELCENIGIQWILEDIRAPLDALGCYKRRDDAVKAVFPEYDPATYKFKIILPQNLLESDRLNFYSLVIQKDGQEPKQARLPLKAYLEIVAATNMKQRTRRMLEYTHADRLNYAVVGTPNRLEYDQGFFVKQGDGIADYKPIAHLYKSQVYALARHMALPAEICSRPPTTDTYSIPQTQEEFYFCLPYDRMDLMLWAHNHKVPVKDVSAVMGLTEKQCELVFKDIDHKRRSTRYQQMHPVLLEPIAEITHEL